MKLILFYLCLGLTLFSSSYAIQANLIYLAGEVLDTIDLFRRFHDNIEKEKDIQTIALDLMEIWAQVDKLAINIDLTLEPNGELYIGDQKHCKESALEIAKLIEPVTSNRNPTISDAIIAMSTISGYLPQAILNCGSLDRLERKYRVYERHYVVVNVNPENLE